MIPVAPDQLLARLDRALHPGRAARAGAEELLAEAIHVTAAAISASGVLHDVGGADERDVPGQGELATSASALRPGRGGSSQASKNVCPTRPVWTSSTGSSTASSSFASAAVDLRRHLPAPSGPSRPGAGTGAGTPRRPGRSSPGSSTRRTCMPGPLRDWKGRNAGYINLLGFAAMTFNFFVINIFISGLHSYAGSTRPLGPAPSGESGRVDRTRPDRTRPVQALVGGPSGGWFRLRRKSTSSSGRRCVGGRARR